MRIIIQTTPHSLQRYNTIGDWYTDRISGDVKIFVSNLANWRYELLIAVHELVEAFQCMHNGVAEEAVTKFDKQFVERDSEPGDSLQAPYAKQHCLATGIERVLAFALDVKWQLYEDTLEKLIVERERLDSGKHENLGNA